MEPTAVAEAFDPIRAVLPVLVDLDDELQEGTLRKLRPGARADLLEHTISLADDHPLLAVALDEDLAAHPRPLDLRDTGGDAVGQLVAGDGEELLAHQLGDPRLLGHLPGDVGVVVGRSLRQQLDDVVDQRVDPRSGSRRHREVRSGTERSCRSQLAGHRLATGAVDLVDDDDGLGDVDPCRDPLVAAPERLGRVQHEAHCVDVVVEAVECRRVDPRAERRRGLVQAGRVDDDELGVGAVEHATHARPRRLRLVADDRHLRATDRVDQRRLADVGSSHERDEAAAEHQPVGAGAVGAGAVVAGVVMLVVVVCGSAPVRAR